MPAIMPPAAPSTRYSDAPVPETIGTSLREFAALNFDLNLDDPDAAEIYGAAALRSINTVADEVAVACAVALTSRALVAEGPRRRALLVAATTMLGGAR